MEFRYWFLLLLIGACGQLSAGRVCDSIDEFPCNNGVCINRLQWCDSVVDCSDGSDELYCDGNNACLSSHFKCGNGQCVPLTAVCDDYEDCPDFSDEEDCGSLPEDYDANTEEDQSPVNVPSASGINGTAANGLNAISVTRAARYLVEQRDADFGWMAFTPRAVVALAFANRLAPVAEKELLEKQLDVHFLLDLMQKKENMTLSSLALYINAFYATCRDPRNFQGINLVDRLRLATTSAARKNSSIPLAYLTLCLSDAMTPLDTRDLANMYNSKEFDRISSRALMVMAMTCYARRNSNNLFENYIQHFLRKVGPRDDADIHTRALYQQAIHSAGYVSSGKSFADEQLPDGSFGDMLATYYAIPVLMNSSLLDLKCNGSFHTGEHSQNLKVIGENRIAFSLWISEDKDLKSHSLTLTFDGLKSFFDVMMLAAAKDPLYKFKYEETSYGKKVYSIAGIPNDIEGGKSWFLYRGNMNSVMVNSDQNLHHETLGVDRISVENRSHFVFWLKRDKISK